MEDNLYPRTSAHLLSEPPQQQLEKQKEAAQTKKALPLLEEIVTYFDERIKFYGSVEAVPDDILVDEKKFMNLVAANKLTVSNLQAEKVYLEELIRTHK